jgi:hypothetical protein
MLHAQEHRFEEVFSAARDLPSLERSAFPERNRRGDVGKRIRCLLRMSRAAILPKRPLTHIRQECRNP